MNGETEEVSSMKFIAIIALTISMTITASAAPKKGSGKSVKPNKSFTTTVQQSASSAEYQSNGKSNSDVTFSASMGLGAAGSAFHFGPTVTGMISISKSELGEIHVGGQTGFLFHPGSVTSWIIPIMVSGQLTFKRTGNITPFAGLAMGVGIFHADLGLTAEQEAAINAAGGDISSTNTDFALLVKGGVYFGEDQKYYAELPLGTLGNAFAILPGVGMKF
jgi:hypothetical protein